MPVTAKDTLRAYLEDVIAAERNFEDVLTTFSKAGEQKAVQELFARFARNAKTQHERLEARLKTLGGSPSTARSFLAHMLGYAPSVAQIGHEAQEKNTQHLIMVVAAAAAEMAMYEALSIAAAEAGDAETEQLARTLQAEERQDYEDTWQLLPSSARESFRKVTGGQKAPTDLHSVERSFDEI
jgi:ferritin-like metal-binding protein YciE